MEKFVWFEEQKFRIREYLDVDVKDFLTNPETGQSFKLSRGDICGVEIYSPNDELIGCFDYVDFRNEEAIKRIIEEHHITSVE